MLRLIAPSVWEFGKWCAYALILLAPGSFIVLLVWWLVDHMKGGLTMSNLESSCTGFPEAQPNSVPQRLRRWWRRDTAEQYLAAATDHADMERRLRALERASGGPAFVTFNH